MNDVTPVPGIGSDPTSRNVDKKTVDGFGVEWSRFNQSELSDEEFLSLFQQYFRLFDLDSLGPNVEGFDAGCGSGRWARGIAPRVRALHCIDASARALEVAQGTLRRFSNCRFYHASLGAIPLPDGSMDFGYSLGVLHHLPDPAAGLASCVAKLKRGAPFLVYLYYAFDNRPAWYRSLWRVSDLLRLVVSRLPPFLRIPMAEVMAVTVYWPLARAAAWLERRGHNVSSFPLAFYRHRTLYTMRTDSLDRLGTRLERRFTRSQITEMMNAAGLVDLRFSDQAPYWCAIGHRNPAR